MAEKEISIAYLKAHISQIADEVEAGDSFVVTRYNLPAFRISGVEGGLDGSALAARAGAAPKPDADAAAEFWRAAKPDVFDAIEALIGRKLSRAESYALSMVYQRCGLDSFPETLASLRAGLASRMAATGKTLGEIKLELDGIDSLTEALTELAMLPASVWAEASTPVRADAPRCPSCGAPLHDARLAALPDEFGSSYDLTCAECGAPVVYYGPREDGYWAAVNPERLPISRLAELAAGEGGGEA